MLMFVFLLACGDSTPTPEAKSNTSVSVEATAVAPVVVTPVVLEALKTADAADGVEDKVATKCSGCALGMDGKAEHSVDVDGYSLHLCSGMCKEYFSKDIAGNLETLIK